MSQRLMRFAETLRVDIQDSQVFYHNHMRRRYDERGSKRKNAKRKTVDPSKQISHAPCGS